MGRAATELERLGRVIELNSPQVNLTVNAARVCRINVLDKILPAGGYFKRFRSPDIRQYS